MGCVFPRYYKVIVCSFFLLLLLPMATVKAHPHAWVSVLTEIEGNDKLLTGLSMFWTFDIMTTSYTLDGENLSESHRQKTLQKLANEMLENIKKNNYFTHVIKQDRSLLFKQPQQAKLMLEDHKLTLQFSLELKTPLLLPITDLNLQIYEDNYFVEFLWLQADDLQLSENFMADCELNIIQPQPTTTQLIYAASLPKNVQPETKLGYVFSQRVSINCQKGAYE